MNRAHWQQLALERLADAEALLAAGRWSAAYYLAGYAVEGALKACIVARLARQPEVIFQERRFSEHSWTHDFAKLVAMADLAADREARELTNPTFRLNWQLVKDWKEESRYHSKTEEAARDLLRAITEPSDGVLPWISTHW